MDWKYGERYNASGEFNPRLIACDNCGEYLEPEEFDPTARQYKFGEHDHNPKNSFITV